MADRISVTYDANIDDLRRKLDELIGLNDKLAQHAFAAAKAIGAISDAQKGMSGNLKIVNQDITKIDNSTKTFNSTTNKLQQSIQNTTNTTNKLQQSISVTTNTVNKFDNSIRNSGNSITKMGNQLDSTQRSLSGFEGVLLKLRNIVGAIFVFSKLKEAAMAILDVERKMELLQNRINFVFDSTTAGQSAFVRLRDTAIRLGTDFQSLAEGFASFGIAAKMAGFSASETEGMFTKVAIGLRAAGASSLQTQRAFYALQQMLSKGVVAAEELRRQLGEALPGASDLMTRAYNRLHPEQELTNRQFTKLLEDGKIISAEVLPELANVIEEVFAPALAGKQTSLDASISRVTTEFERFKLSLSNFLPTKTAFNILSDFFGDLNLMMESGYKEFIRLGAIAASGNLTAFRAAMVELEAARSAKMAKDAKEEKEIEKRVNHIAELYLKQGISSTKAIAGENDRIIEQRKELKALNEELRKREVALNKVTQASASQVGGFDQSGPQKIVQAQRAVEQQKLLVNEKAKEIEFTTRLITKIGQLGQKREEEKEQLSNDAMKAAQKAAEEALAAERFRLTQLTKGTEEYNKQLISIIDAQITLKKISFADTPEQLKLALAELNKLKKETEALTKMESFKAAFELSVIEKEPIEEQLKKYKQFIDSKTEYELEKNNYSENERKALIKKSEKEIEKFRLDSLNKQLELEIKQIEKQISDISRIEGKAVSATVGIGVDTSGVDKIDSVTGNRVVGVEVKVDADELKKLDGLLKEGKQLEVQISPEIDQSGLSGVNELLKDKDAKIDVSIGGEGESQAKDLLKRLEELKKQAIKNDIAIKDLSATTSEETASNAIEEETRAQALISEGRKSELQNEILRQKVLVLSTQEGTEERLKAEQDLLTREAELRKLDTLESKDSAEKKALNIKLIDAQLKEDLGRLNKEFLEEASEENKKAAELDQKIRDAIERSEADSYGRRILKIKQFYRKLIVEAKFAGRDTAALEGAMTREISKEQVKQVNEFINAAGDLYNKFTQVQEMEYNNQKVALKNKLEQGLISEEQYNAEVTRLEKKRFEQNKDSQRVNVLINTASAIIRAFSDLGPVGGAIAAAVISQLSIQQLAAINSSQFPQGFKEGVIDLRGPGTETSDSIPARLSRGESVMTAQETRDYKPVLQAIRDNNFEEFVSKKYIDAMNVNKPLRSESFAENISNSFDLQTEELINAIGKNKRVKIDNVKELAEAINPRTIRDRVIRKSMK